MQCKFNKFTKKPNSKTSYCLEQGEPIFGQTLYLLNPLYVHGRSPAFTMVWKGKHISGFYSVAGSGAGFIGDYKNQGLLLYLKESGFDLFITDLSPVQLRAKLHTPEFTEELYKAQVAA